MKHIREWNTVALVLVGFVSGAVFALMKRARTQSFADGNLGEWALMIVFGGGVGVVLIYALRFTAKQQGK